MKILHICLASFYIDNYSYQENMLPKYHKKLGFEVEIIASLVSFDENGNVCLLKKNKKYKNENGISVTRLNYKKLTGSKSLRRYEGTYQAILNSKPDIIFIHGCQFLDINQVIKYVRQHNTVKVYVDNHADFSNSARTWISKNILHKIIWKRCAKMIYPISAKFYGVLPARVDFLKDMYKIPSEKVELLVMGADDEKVKDAKKDIVRKEIRAKYNIKPEDFLIITGGKIDNAKRQTMLLLQAVKQIKNKNVKIIVFGSVVNELKKELDSLLDDEKVQYIGWIHSDDSYKHFVASDLGIFPGRHSVLWEQAIGTGLPCVFKYWEGTTHVDIGGNCEFLYEDTVKEISQVITELLDNKKKYNNMKFIAETKGINHFSYYEIAKKSIEY